MTDPQIFSLIFMGFVVLVIAGIDVWLAVNDVEGDTFSESIRKLQKIWPPLKYIIIFGMGLLTGHLFW